MIKLNLNRIYIYILVFALSFFFSLVHYYYFNIEKFEWKLHQIDLNLNWQDLIFLNKKENQENFFLSKTLVSSLINITEENINKNTNFKLSDIKSSSLIEILPNITTLCLEWSCNNEEIKKEILDLASFIKDIQILKILWIKLDKDTSYTIDYKKYYIINNKIYSYNEYDDILRLEYEERKDSENKKIKWKEIWNEETNKIRKKVLLKKIWDLPYYLKYKLWEQSGKIKST